MNLDRIERMRLSWYANAGTSDVTIAFNLRETSQSLMRILFRVLATYCFF